MSAILISWQQYVEKLVNIALLGYQKLPNKNILSAVFNTYILSFLVYFILLLNNTPDATILLQGLLCDRFVDAF